MNKEVLNRGGIDYDRGVARFSNRADIYERVLREFPKDTAMSRACASFAANDREQLLRDVHELKGVSGNMDMTELFRISSALVALLRSGNYSDAELNASFAGLSSAYDAVIAAIDESENG